MVRKNLLIGGEQPAGQLLLGIIYLHCPRLEKSHSYQNRINSTWLSKTAPAEGLNY